MLTRALTTVNKALRLWPVAATQRSHKEANVLACMLGHAWKACKAGADWVQPPQPLPDLPADDAPPLEAAPSPWQATPSFSQRLQALPSWILTDLGEDTKSDQAEALAVGETWLCIRLVGKIRLELTGCQ
jgi:hypothetical protein